MLKVMQKRALLAFAAIAFASTFLTLPTFADDVDYNVSINNSLRLTIPATSIDLTLDPATKPFDSKSLSFSVATNNPTGYKLMMSSDSTNLIKTSDNTKTIPTLTELAGGYTNDTFEVNKWGYKIGAGNYIPFISGATIAENDTTTNDQTTTLTFATKINYLQPEGEYKMVLNFAAVANVVTYYLQDINNGLCPTTPTVAIDSRDNQEYIIQRLADGNCWMMDNLNLGAVDLAVNLTSENTNITSTISADTFNSWKKEIADDDFTLPQYIPVAGADNISSTPYGTLYNFCATSANTVCGLSDINNAPYDICPAGWRLPTGGADGEFQRLYDNPSYNTYAKLRAPVSEGGLAFALSGSFPTNSQGSVGFYWSPMHWNIDYAYGVYIDDSDADPSAHITRDTGGSIRCVLKGEDVSSINYLQDVTREIVNNTTTGTVATLKDKRDNEEYKIARLLDGNLWLLDNLRLNLTTISLETLDGNTNASYTALHSLKNGGGASPYAANTVSSEWTGSAQNSYDSPYISTTYKDTVAPVTYGEGSGKIGIYYNYCAASAGSFCHPEGSGQYSYTHTISDDICPTGWQIPAEDDAWGEYGWLYGNHYYDSDGTLIRTALSTPLSGSFYDGTTHGLGEYGDFWGSTAERNSTGRHYFRVNRTSIQSSLNHEYEDRFYGRAVRCIFNQSYK